MYFFTVCWVFSLVFILTTSTIPFKLYEIQRIRTYGCVPHFVPLDQELFHNTLFYWLTVRLEFSGWILYQTENIIYLNLLFINWNYFFSDIVWDPGFEFSFGWSRYSARLRRTGKSKWWNWTAVIPLWTGAQGSFIPGQNQASGGYWRWDYYDIMRRIQFYWKPHRNRTLALFVLYNVQCSGPIHRP